MKKIPAFTVLLLMAVAALVGAAVIPSLNVQYAPSVAGRKISVSFRWPNASERTMEAEVTSRIEGALSGMEGCTSVSSVSELGSGSVTLSFHKKADMAAVRFEVASRIRNIYTTLPEGVTYPSISLNTGGTRGYTALTYVVKSPLPSQEIEKFVKGNVIMPLSSVDGVDKVSFWGATPYELEIVFDSKSCEACSITADNIASAFDVWFSSDVLGMKETSEGTVTVMLECMRSGDIGDIPVAESSGRIIHLRDIATWRYVESAPESYYRLNGLNTVMLSIDAVSKTSLLKTVSDVKKTMSALQSSFPSDITVTLSYDSSEYVVSELNKIYFRTLLCVIVLLVFVYLASRSCRYLFVIFSTLTVNVLVAAVFYRLFSLPVHIYTLAGITVSLGIVIDTSIVMADHYSYYRNRSVFPALLGATATTIGALCVIILLPDEEKANLEDFTKVIMINLGVSLLTAYFFIPSLIDRFPVRSGRTAASSKSYRRAVKWRGLYESYIRKGLKHRWIYISVLVAGFGIPLFLLPDKVAEHLPEEEHNLFQRVYNSVMSWSPYKGNREVIDKVAGTSFCMFAKALDRSDFYREPGRDVLYIRAGMPEGCSVVQLDGVVRHMENYLSLFEEIESFTTRIRSYDDAEIAVVFKPEYENTYFPAELKAKVISMASDFGGAVWRVWGVNDSYFNNDVVTNYKSHSILLYGYNYDELYGYAESLVEYLSGNRRVSAPEIMTSGADMAGTEYNLDYNFGYLTDMGVSPYAYYGKLHSILYDTALPGIITDEGIIPVVLRSSEKDSFDLWNVLNSQIAVDSVAVRLSEIGTIEKKRTGLPVFRRNQSYELMVGFDFIGSFELARSYVEKTVKHFNEEVLPVGYKVEQQSFRWWGKESRMRYMLLVLLVIVIIYVMCAMTFESLKFPFAVILMIPVSFIGVFLVFGLSDFVFDQGGFAAFVMLCGIVVNAGIYLTNDYKNLRALHSLHRTGATYNGIVLCGGKKSDDGIKDYVRAFSHKIRPILLTVVSTILGLVPFLFDGPDEVFWFAFAIGVTGGLIFSLLALILYLPVFINLHYLIPEGDL